MSKGEIVFSYVFIGTLVFIFSWGSDNGALGYSAPEAAGIAFLWPLFAIKYLCIGIWIVFSSGVSILVGF